MDSLAQELRLKGSEVDFATADSLPSDSKYDLVHATALFYLPDSLQRVVEWSLKWKLPLVVSPLAEDILDQWYDKAWRSKMVWYWRLFRAGAGYSLGRVLYRRWQLFMIRRTDEFRAKRATLLASRVVVNTEQEAQLLRAWYGLPQLSVDVAPLGIDAVHFDPATVSNIPVVPCLPGYVLQVSRLQEHKNQHMLIEALFDDPHDIVLAGAEFPHEPDYARRCRALAKARGRVHILGRVPYADLPSLYAHAGLHAFPSWSERPGLVTLEAAAMGCPVISSVNSTIDEYLPGMVVWCDPASPDSLRDAVTRVRSSEVDRTMLSRRARRYTWQKTADAMREIYRATLGQDA
jgi:glycosyltransferase involved in cell wall biosynthesis